MSTKINKKTAAAAEELRELQESASAYTSGISGKRTRRATKKDEAYFAAVAAEEADAGARGGLVAGSGYHYDRAYNGHNYCR
jgi:hypothetical protein